MKFNLSSVKLHPKAVCNVLAPASFKFLASLFRAFDVEKQGFISQNSVQQIFQVCEKVPHEFDFNLPTTPIGEILNFYKFDTQFSIFYSETV